MLATENLWRAWSWQPLVLIAGAAAIACFVHGWLRLRRRRALLAPWHRLSLFAAGVTVTVLAIVSPIDRIGETYLQSAHMLQHVLIADLGIVLILLAVRGPLTVFFLPRTLLQPLSRLRWLRAGLAFLLRPAVSYAVWLIVLVGWHIPAAYDAALSSRPVHDVEHLGFVVGGMLVWTQIIDPSRHRRLSVAQRLGYTALVFWTGQVLASVLVFGFEPFYPAYPAQGVRLLDLSPLTDQRLAGIVMMAEQLLTVGGAFVLLLRASHSRRTKALSAARGQPA